MVQPIRRTTRLNKDPLSIAKRVPITSMYKGTLKQTGKVLMGLCIAHDDHNPSMAIYPETNTVHCFACDFSGDSIAFYQKLHDCSFQEALRELNGV